MNHVLYFLSPYTYPGQNSLVLANEDMACWLNEAMEHENLLEVEAFWDNIQQAIALLAGVPYTPATPSAPSDSGQPYHGDYQEFTPAPQAEDDPPGAPPPDFEDFAPTPTAD